jgi:hypothetical protein
MQRTLAGSPSPPGVGDGLPERLPIMSPISDMPPIRIRDALFIWMALLVITVIWADSWGLPVSAHVAAYILLLATVFPLIKYTRMTGIDTLGLALVPAIAMCIMMLASIGRFVSEFLL